MKKRTIAYIALVLFGVGAGILFPRFHEKWTDTGSQLVLSLKGSSPDNESCPLEIRCDGSKSEVRLYVPIGITPAFGGPLNGRAQGPAEMGLTDIFQDTERVPLPRDGDCGNIWILDKSQDFAVKQDPTSFIARLMGKDWLLLRGVGYGDPTTGFKIDFPVMGLSDYQHKIASSCRG